MEDLQKAIEQKAKNIAESKFDKKWKDIFSGLGSAVYLKFDNKNHCVVDNNFNIVYELEDEIVDILYKQELERLISNIMEKEAK